MNRDTPYRPQPRSVNGVERQPVSVRPTGVMGNVTPRAEIRPQVQPVAPPPSLQPRLIDDFHRHTRIASERLMQPEPSVTNELMAAAVAHADTEQEEAALHSVQFTPATVGAGSSTTGATVGSPVFEMTPIPGKSVKRTTELWIRYGIPVIATLLIGIGVTMAIVSIMNNLSLQEQVKTYAAEAADSGEVKGESQGGVMPVSNVTDPRAPKHIDISTIDVSASMTIVGVNNKGNIGSPANIRQASWYKGSDSPLDSQGDAMIVGHVGTDRYAGVFARLHELKEGDTITLTMGDAKQLVYEVTESVDVAPEAMDVGTYIGRGAAHKDSLLHLVTCTGEYNARTHTYDHRLIVTAKRL